MLRGEKKFRNSNKLIIRKGILLRETDKAFLAKIGRVTKRTQWFPKSICFYDKDIIKDTNTVWVYMPEWFMSKVVYKFGYKKGG